MPPPPSELLYAAANNAILGFAVDPASGLLSAPTYTPGPSLPCGGDASPYQGIVSLPKLGLLYVSDGENNQVGGSFYGRVFNNQVDGFAVSKTTGTLTPLLGSPFPLPLPMGFPNAYPQGMATDPEGKFLYVFDPADIDALAINSTTGALTFISGVPLLGGVGPNVAIDPSGSFLFADSLFGISAVALDANTGAMTGVAGSPFALPGGLNVMEFPNALVVDTTGSFLYVVVDEFQEGGQPEISYLAAYSIDATSGSLTQIPDTPSFGSALPSAIATVGNFLYVNNSQGIYAYSITSGTGVLTQVSGSPFPAATTAGGLTATSDGKFLFEAGSDQIYVFTIDPTTGALSANGNPVPAAGGPFLLNLYTP
jgi:6-phosphogluconolactonase